MSKSYLITGGAGFLGINLTRYLMAKGQRATSLDIDPVNYEDVYHHVKVITGDIRHYATVESALADIDIVIHAAAALPL